MEKLGLAAVLIYGALASAVLDRRKLSLLNRPGAVWQVLTELHASGRRPHKAGEARPVHDAITYLENHGERMRYAKACQRGLPIGSGGVEAARKSLVTLRMKRLGSRWKEPSGQHVLDLRSLVLSDRWQPAMELTLAPLRFKSAWLRDQDESQTQASGKGHQAWRFGIVTVPGFSMAASAARRR